MPRVIQVWEWAQMLAVDINDDGLNIMLRFLPLSHGYVGGHTKYIIYTMIYSDIQSVHVPNWVSLKFIDKINLPRGCQWRQSWHLWRGSSSWFPCLVAFYINLYIAMVGLKSDYLTKVKAYNALSFIRWPQKVTKVKMYTDQTSSIPPTYPEDKLELIDLNLILYFCIYFMYSKKPLEENPLVSIVFWFLCC